MSEDLPEEQSNMFQHLYGSPYCVICGETDMDQLKLGGVCWHTVVEEFIKRKGLRGTFNLRRVCILCPRCHAMIGEKDGKEGSPE